MKVAKQRSMPNLIRTLTVTQGRDTVGCVNAYADGRFLALVAITGEELGPFASRADAAQALSLATTKPAGGVH